MKNYPMPDHHSRRYDEIGTLIRTYRLNDGMTQKNFSDMAEIHINTLQNLESGKQISVNTLFRCIDAMGMSLSEFFEGIE
jgi:transcriptional regulator with XRE-family HTH domain